MNDICNTVVPAVCLRLTSVIYALNVAASCAEKIDVLYSISSGKQGEDLLLL